MTAALDRAVAHAMGLKSVHNCEKWGRTMIEEDDDTQVYKKPWVGLTDEDIGAAYVAWDATDGASFADFARAVEQLLKEKNNGL
jgi:hypothetical protein